VKWLVIALAACGPADVIGPGAARPLPPAREVVVDTTPKARPRMMPTEVYLRAYLTWFGGLAPGAIQARMRPLNMFDTWNDYLAALGLPDYKIDLPRQSQTNTLMLSAFGRLGEALCVQAVEHDLHSKKTPLADRVIFAFEPTAKPPTADEFAPRFDVLHRTFLGYPAALAPAERTAKFFALHQAVAKRHAKGRITADESGWAAVCSALVQHPETGLY
jgi:hypothetical protein